MGNPEMASSGRKQSTLKPMIDRFLGREQIAMEETLKPGRYRHFKGNEYELLYVARHSETLEEMVVYRALYGEGGVWVRPADMWSEIIERDGVSVPRFSYLGE